MGMGLGPLCSRVRLGLVAVLAASGLTGCAAVNTIPTLEERAKSAWSEVQNQYQRRADLIPNLVKTVKGYAAQERDVLVQVTEARARAATTSARCASTTPSFAPSQGAGSPRSSIRTRSRWRRLRRARGPIGRR